MATNPENTNLGKLDILISRLLADEQSGNLRTIDLIHEKIHRGQVYVFSYHDDAVANGNSLDILFRVGPSLSSHAIATVTSTGDAEIYLYESPTTSADGTVVNVKNKNRYSSDTKSFSVFHTPTVDTVGTELINPFIAGGSGGLKIGASSEQRDEWVLKNGLDYLIRITNVSGQAAKINIVSSLYEVSMD